MKNMDDRKIKQAVAYLRQYPGDVQAAYRAADQAGDYIDSRQWMLARKEMKGERR